MVGLVFWVVVFEVEGVVVVDGEGFVWWGWWGVVEGGGVVVGGGGGGGGEELVGYFVGGFGGCWCRSCYVVGVGEDCVLGLVVVVVWFEWNGWVGG